MPVTSFNENNLRKLAEILADAYTHRELSGILTQCGITEQGGDPKWERALLALSARQKTDGCGNNVAAFLQATMDPVRFAGRAEQFSSFRNRLNEVLAFSGLQLADDGKLTPVAPARTLTEAHGASGAPPVGIAPTKGPPGCPALLPGGTATGELLPRRL